jgi:hypothetical protein
MFDGILFLSIVAYQIYVLQAMLSDQQRVGECVRSVHDRMLEVLFSTLL